MRISLLFDSFLLFRQLFAPARPPDEADEPLLFVNFEVISLDVQAQHNNVTSCRLIKSYAHMYEVRLWGTTPRRREFRLAAQGKK